MVFAENKGYFVDGRTKAWTLGTGLGDGVWENKVYFVGSVVIFDVV